jgi:hypothetical protein
MCDRSVASLEPDSLVCSAANMVSTIDAEDNSITFVARRSRVDGTECFRVYG